MPSEAHPHAFGPDGELRPGALKNIIVALLNRMGGQVQLSWKELEATNNTGFFHPMSDTDILLIVDEGGGGKWGNA